MKAAISSSLVTSADNLEAYAAVRTSEVSQTPLVSPVQLPNRAVSPSDRVVRRVRIFVSSPADVSEERSQVHAVVSELNTTVASSLGLVLELITQATNVYPAAGRPQPVINDQLPDYDIFLGILSRQFGSPTSVMGSGTEEEFQGAIDRWRATGRPKVLFYFCDAPAALLASGKAADQLLQVLAFGNKVRSIGLIAQHTFLQNFANTLRPQLALLLQREFGSAASSADPRRCSRR